MLPNTGKVCDTGLILYRETSCFIDLVRRFRGFMVITRLQMFMQICIAVIHIICDTYYIYKNKVKYFIRV